MTGNYTLIKYINPGDRLVLGGMMTGIIDTVYNLEGVTTLKIKDIVIYNGPGDEQVLAFFPEKNKKSFFFKKEQHD